MKETNTKSLILYLEEFCGLYCKLITMVNDDSCVVNKLETSLIDDTRDIIYDLHMFIAQATDIIGQNILSSLIKN